MRKFFILLIIALILPYAWLRSLVPLNYEEIFIKGLEEIKTLNFQFVAGAQNIQPVRLGLRKRPDEPYKILACKTGEADQWLEFTVETTNGLIKPTFVIEEIFKFQSTDERPFTGKFFHVRIRGLSQLKGFGEENLRSFREDSRKIAREIVTEPRMTTLLKEGEISKGFNPDTQSDRLKWIDTIEDGEPSWFFELEGLPALKKALEITSSKLPGSKYEGLPTPAYLIPLLIYRCSIS